MEGVENTALHQRQAAPQAPIGVINIEQVIVNNHHNILHHKVIHGGGDVCVDCGECCGEDGMGGLEDICGDVLCEEVMCCKVHPHRGGEEEFEASGEDL